MTLNLGFRFGSQRTYFLDSESTPFFSEFFPTGVTTGQDVVKWNTFAPRLGATFDITGEGRTVFKAHYGRYFVNLADVHRRNDPANVAWQRFDFLDQNQNGLFGGAQELGVLRTESGATGTALGSVGTPVNPDLDTEFVDEVSLSIEHEIMTDTSLRVSYVHKSLNGDSGQWNIAQQTALLEGRGIPCGDAVFPCPLNALTGQPLNLVRVPDDVANVVDIQTDTFPGLESNYDTIQFALNRRFTSGFFVQGSFDYQWRDEFRAATGESTSPLTADPIDVGSDGHGTIWQNHSLDTSFRQENTNWNARFLARYVTVRDIGISTNIRLQSGWAWAPTQSVSIPGTSTVRVFLDDIDRRRSDNVAIVDIRLEKGFNFSGGRRLTGMFDMYNIFNSNPETNFTIRTGSTFENIIAVLDPRAFKLGVRFQF